MMKEKVDAILKRHHELEELLALPETIADQAAMIKLSREYNGITKNSIAFKRYLTVLQSIAEAEQIIRTESDEEMLQLAREELQEGEPLLTELEQKIKLLLVPRDPQDAKNAVLEIRAGTGGTEAGIFGADLYRMYCHYIENKGFSYEVLGSSFGEVGAIKEIILLIKGDSAYGTFKYESGVHRVQRVPQTEAQGRVHTSAASVVVLPEADEFEVSINPNDLRIDHYCFSGPGGQSVNTTYSAVRIVHVPTGITVTCQDEKSQLKNRAKALKVLQTRLYEQKLSEVEEVESEVRKNMVSTGERSVKIRTYNFPQNRLTDHRINLTLYSLDRVMDGDLDELIHALGVADLNERVKQTGL